MKTFVTVLLSFILGAICLYAWMAFSASQASPSVLPIVVSPAPTSTPVPTLEPSPTPEPVATNSAQQPVSEFGSISGTLGYPSEGIPPLEVFAINKAQPTKFFKVLTKQNQTTFTIESIEPGTYVVVAFPQNSAQLTGGYSQAVACGLSVECTDHSLVPVIVTAGKLSSGVAVKDWYAPENAFPSKPE